MTVNNYNNTFHQYILSQSNRNKHREYLAHYR